ncbi:MAG: TonB-dependent receptor [Curvibacter sp.]|nr:TonB-dependent receptor [Curvibacter sp.]
MRHVCPLPRKKWITLLSLATLSLAGAAFADTVDLGTVGGSSGTGAASTPSVKADRGTAASVAPTQASLKATEPQSIISRAFIENSTPPTGNFNTILSIAPSVASTPSTNGPGLSDQKMSLRGFQDGEYNVTFDGIPFGDSNGPTHHSTSYFPASVIGGMVIERGPGNASNIGYSTYGGSINLFSKAPSEQQGVSIYGSVGTWRTHLEGLSYESGRMEGSDATLQMDVQHMSTDGALSYSNLVSKNFTLKYQRPIGDSTLMTLFASLADVKNNTTDNASGPTAAQIKALGSTYVMNNNPGSQGYWGYNFATKQTDMEYIRLQSHFASGWETDNNTYTYAYTNSTIAGQDPTQYNGTADTTLGFKNLLGKTTTLPNGDVPGYFKLNEYRVWGDVFKATKQTGPGLLRLGFWYEGSRTQRHNLEADLTTGQQLPGASSAYPTGVVTSSNFADQFSNWHQIQPFAEYEWAAAQGLTVTPGLKTMYYHMGLESAMNQKALTPQGYQYTYHATLPFLTVNKQLDAENSLYTQYAKGMEVPFLGVGSPSATPPAPQTTTNYQFGAVHKADRLTLSGDVYYIDMNNMQLNTGTNANPVYINAGGATYKGIEGEGTYMVTTAWAAYANFGVNSARYKSSNAAAGQPVGEVPNAPNMTSALGALYNEGPWNASLIYKRIGEQYNSKLGGQLHSIGNTDLNVAYTWSNLGTMGMKKLRLQFSIFNLTNQQNLVGVTGPLSSAATQYQWQAPRSYMLSAKADF